MAVAPSPESADRAAAEPLLALADRCVQCGLCLPHCPTYQLDRNEAESPRGRIALWRGLADGSLAPSADTDLHLDHCLSCGACEAACPAGVRYSGIALLGRRQQRRRRGPDWKQRGLEWLSARPALLDRLLGGFALLHPWLPARLRVLPPAPRPARSIVQNAQAPCATVQVFLGCAGRRYDAPARAALERLLACAGIAVDTPAGQTCCGALHAHAGNAAAATALGAANARALHGPQPVLCTASGCQQQLAAALAGHSTVVDVFELLDRHADVMAFRASTRRVALQRPCTQQRLDGSVEALRRVLARIPGLSVVELPSACCGAAGTQMLTDPGRAARLARPLIEATHAGAADTLLSANVGCRLHLARLTGLPVQHPLEFLAEHLP